MIKLYKNILKKHLNLKIVKIKRGKNYEKIQTSL